MSERRYLPEFSELIDRLSINSIKELLITDHRKEYSEEIKDILHDIDLIVKEKNISLDANFIRDIMLVMFYNREIWLNEGNWRKGIREGNNLELSHGLNSIRNLLKNNIQEKIGGRKDYKLDNVEAFPQWVPSGYEK